MSSAENTVSMFEYWTLHGSSTKSSIISSKDLRSKHSKFRIPFAPKYKEVLAIQNGSFV
jgi:hypothetical protein